MKVFLYFILCLSVMSLMFIYINQFLSPLKLWVWFPFMERCIRCNIVKMTILMQKH